MNTTEKLLILLIQLVIDTHDYTDLTTIKQELERIKFEDKCKNG